MESVTNTDIHRISTGEKGIEMQKKLFENWMNTRLKRSGARDRVRDLFGDTREGQLLILLLEAITGDQLPRVTGVWWVFTLVTYWRRKWNLEIVLNYLESHRVSVEMVSVYTLINADPKETLRLISVLISNFEVGVRCSELLTRINCVQNWFQNLCLTCDSNLQGIRVELWQHRASLEADRREGGETLQSFNMARGERDIPELTNALHMLQNMYHLTRLYLDMLNVIEAALSHLPTAWDCLRRCGQQLRERRSQALSSGTAIDTLRQDLKYVHMDLDDQRECFWDLEEGLSEMAALNEQVRKSNQSWSINLTLYNQNIQSIIQQQQALHCQIDHRLLVLLGIRRRLEGFQALYKRLMACQVDGDNTGLKLGVNNTKNTEWMAQLMEQYRIHAVQYMEACKGYELQTELFNHVMDVGLELVEEEPGSVCTDIIQQTLAVCDVLNSHRHDRADRSETETLVTLSERGPGLVLAVPPLGSDLSGTGCVAGVLHEALGETLALYEAQCRGLVRPAIALALLEAQAATGGLMEPGKTERLSVDEAVRRGVVGPELHDTLLSAERAVTGYKDPYTGRFVPLFQAMKKQLIVADYANRLLEAQLSTGGMVDPEHRHRLPLEVAYQRGCLDQETQRLLTNPTAGVKGFSDPNTEEQLSYRQLLGRCRPGPGPGLLLLPLNQERPSFRGLRRRVTVEELLEAQVIGADTAEELESGRTTPQKVSRGIKAYLRGSGCVAGLYLQAKGRPLSIYQAMNEGLVLPGTGLLLLEAQAATGFIVEPRLGLELTVEAAVQRRVVGPELQDKLLAAERAVTGYMDPYTGHLLSLFQALSYGLIMRSHAARLLQAQLATGGIIDPEHSHRLPLAVALSRGLLDEDMHQSLTQPSSQARGFFHPATGHNLTYQQLLQSCMSDPSTGLLLLPLGPSQAKASPHTARPKPPSPS